MTMKKAIKTHLDAKIVNAIVPNQSYGLVLADPPWHYDGYDNGRGACINHYPIMTLTQLKRMQINGAPIADVCAKDSVLLLWATFPKLREAFSVMNAWGFDYVTGFPWVKATAMEENLGRVKWKPGYGVGYWVRGASELVLIGRRGKVRHPTRGYIGLLSPNYEHSRKPDSIYQLAESLPGPYLELFARRSREGWTSFGNQVP